MTYGTRARPMVERGVMRALVTRPGGLLEPMQRPGHVETALLVAGTSWLVTCSCGAYGAAQLLSAALRSVQHDGDSARMSA